MIKTQKKLENNDESNSYLRELRQEISLMEYNLATLSAKEKRRIILRCEIEQLHEKLSTQKLSWKDKLVLESSIQDFNSKAHQDRRKNVQEQKIMIRYIIKHYRQLEKAFLIGLENN
jgi:hypothetical protein